MVLDSAKKLVSRIPDTRIHIVLVVLWILLMIPTFLFWSTSILWVLTISIYANIAAHLAAYEGAKNDDKIDRIIELLEQLKEDN